MQRLLLLVPLWLSLTVHEWAHAWTAWRLGDDTSARLGRLTLDPLAHMDPVGTLLLPLLGIPFGWAKPVPVNPSRFHRAVPQREGLALVAGAGPAANVVLAILGIGVLVGLAHAAPTLVAPDRPLRMLLETFVFLNAALAFFNLLPLPPLDGSRLADAWMPRALQGPWRALLSVGPAALVAVVVVPLWLGATFLFWPMEFTRELLAGLLP